MTAPRRLVVELLGILLRAHPRSFRERFGADVEREMRECLRSGDRGAAFLVTDALVTLGREWTSIFAKKLRSAAGAFVETGGGKDLRLAIRSLHRHPLHAGVIIATLAVAIGANTAVFTVAHRLLFRTPPYDAPDRIVRIVPMPDYALDHPAIEVQGTYYEDAGANLEEGAEASRISLAQVSADFIRVMGVTPVLGRAWEGDDGAGATLISHRLWTSAFGADPDVVGRELVLNGLVFRVSGVLPPDVDFPVGAEAWVSLPLIPEFYSGVIGSARIVRLRTGVSVPDLAVDLERRATVAVAAGEELSVGDRRPQILPTIAGLTAPVRAPLLILSGAALLILLLGCANVAGVSLARLSAREQELALRGALGVGRARLFRQLAIEVAVPAVLAGGLSTLIATGGVSMIRAQLPPDTPNLAGLAPGPELAWATGIATVAVGLLAGLLPALSGAGRLRRVRAGTTVSDDPRRQRIQSGLAVAQIALAVVLVTGAALMGRSLARVYGVPVGFFVDIVLRYVVRLPRSHYPNSDSWRDYHDRAEAALRQAPSVEAVGASSRLPLADGPAFGYDVYAEGSSAPLDDSPIFISVSPDYFDAIGTQVLEGASLEEAADDVVFLSHSMARALFPTGAVVGRSIRVVRGPRDEGTTARVAGVVEDVRRRGPENEAVHVVYRPLSHTSFPFLGFALRYRGNPQNLASVVHEALMTVDASVPPFDIRTTAEALSERVATRRSVSAVASIFGVIALLLAVLGVYGLMSHAVGRRRRELGVRMALGAGAGRLMAMVLGRGIAVAAVGIGLGVLGALAATRVLSSLLYEVSATDPATFVSVALVVAAAALLACWLPARRAGQTDPISSLRVE